MNIKTLFIGLLAFFASGLFLEMDAQTEILKWKDGKKAGVSITFDDGTLNHYNIAIPHLNKLNMPGTFFINTAYVSGSRYEPTFVGRPIMNILKESETTATSKTNLYERTSMIRYFAEIQKSDELKEYDMYNIGHNIEAGNYDEVFSTVDEICTILRNSGKEYQATSTANPGDDIIGWDKIRQYAAGGHEFAAHTISHPQLSNLDEKNILYELGKCREDIKNNLGFKHTLTVECPYGIHDERVMKLTPSLFPFSRNMAPEEYLTGIMRSDKRMPGEVKNEYIQWQKGPLSKTPYSEMYSWINTILEYDNVWLVLVFHGIEGIGWEAIPRDIIEKYYDYIKSHEDELWVATFQDTYKYIHERMNSSVTQTNKSNSIKVTINNKLDKKIYDIPLTLKTTIPDTWEKVKIKTGEKEDIREVVNNGNGNFVIYNVSPQNKTVTLSKVN